MPRGIRGLGVHQKFWKPVGSSRGSGPRWRDAHFVGGNQIWTNPFSFYIFMVIYFSFSFLKSNNGRGGGCHLSYRPKKKDIMSLELYFCPVYHKKQVFRILPRIFLFRNLDSLVSKFGRHPRILWHKKLENLE